MHETRDLSTRLWTVILDRFGMGRNLAAARLSISPCQPDETGKSQNLEEVSEILFLFVGKPDLEPAIVEIHQFTQIARGTIGEVRRTGAQPTELLHQDGTYVCTFSGDECAARVLS